MPDKPSQPAPRDSDLLRRHLEGDPEAFAALVRRYQRDLYNFLARFTGDATLAEDVFQETMLQLHISAGTFDLSRPLKPWLFTIAANKARDALRRKARRSAAPLDAKAGANDSDAGTYADLMPSEIPSPPENVMNLETRRTVVKIVEDMPDDLRAVLMLSYFEGFAYKEIARILDIPLGTVKSRLHAAVKYFARQWKAAAEHDKHEQAERAS